MRLRDDMLKVGAKPAATAPAAFARLRGDLHRAHESERKIDRVALLNTAWPSFLGAIHQAGKAIERLRARLGRKIAVEPAALTVHLLGAVDGDRREVLHTRAIAKLLNEACPFRDEMLRAFVGGVAVVDVADLKVARVETEPSRPTGRGRGRRWVEPDLVVTMTDGRSLLIENKIDAHDHDLQLNDYLDCMKGEDVLAFVYLTPDRRGPVASAADSWTLVGYSDLAVAWRRTLARLEREAPDDAWTWLLRFYLATVVQEIWGIRMDKTGRLVGRTKAPVRLRAYLQAAVEG